MGGQPAPCRCVSKKKWTPANIQKRQQADVLTQFPTGTDPRRRLITKVKTDSILLLVNGDSLSGHHGFCIGISLLALIRLFLSDHAKAQECSDSHLFQIQRVEMQSSG